MQTVAERLEWAMDRAEYSQRALAEALKGRGLTQKGATRQMIGRYLAAGAEGPLPPIEFIREVSDVLGVREAWLAFGDGEVTEARQEESRVGAVLRIGPIVEANPWLEEVWATTSLSPFLGRWLDLSFHAGELYDVGVGKRLAAFLIRPFEEFGLDPDFSGEFFPFYMEAMLQALGLVPPASTNASFLGMTEQEEDSSGS